MRPSPLLKFMYPSFEGGFFASAEIAALKV
jgi:hypothetical protein